MKGAAILLVVLGHCVSYATALNTFPDYQSVLRLWEDFGHSFRMQLFFTVSGFLFFLSKGYDKFKIKVLDFGIVYVIWSVIIWCSKYFFSKPSDLYIPYTIWDLFGIVYKPLQVLWYLYVLCLFYIALSLFKQRTVTWRMLGATAILSLVLGYFDPNQGYNVFYRFAYYLYFFLLGGYLYQSDLLSRLKQLHVLGMLGFIVFNCAVYLSFGVHGGALFSLKNFLLANSASLLFFYIFSRLKPSSILIFCGKYTMSIYVMHSSLIGVIRTLFRHYGWMNVYLYFLVGAGLGMVLPILAARLCKHYPQLNIFFEPVASLERMGVKFKA